MWTLVSSSTTVAPGSNEFNLLNEGIAHIIVSANSNHAEVVRVLDPRMQRELGRISMFFNPQFSCVRAYIASRRTFWSQVGSRQ